MPYPRLNARFPRKRAFITGAGSGLGLELARALAGEGWSLGLFDRNLETLTQVEGALSAAGIPVVAYPGDVTQADELTVAVNSFAATHDGLDVMINNAGVAGCGTLMEIPLEDWRWIIDINLMGVVHGCRAAVPHLQRNGSGLLINVASAAAFASAPGMGSYNATKAAVLSLSETLWSELRSANIQVSVVMPTYFKTDLLASVRGPEHLRAAAAKRMHDATYPATAVANDVLTMASEGTLYILAPKQTRKMWRMKRWMPESFLKKIAAMRSE